MATVTILLESVLAILDGREVHAMSHPVLEMETATCTDFATSLTSMGLAYVHQVGRVMVVPFRRPVLEMGTVLAMDTATLPRVFATVPVVGRVMVVPFHHPVLVMGSAMAMDTATLPRVFATVPVVGRVMIVPFHTLPWEWEL